MKLTPPTTVCQLLFDNLIMSVSDFNIHDIVLPEPYTPPQPFAQAQSLIYSEPCALILPPNIGPRADPPDVPPDIKVKPNSKTPQNRGGSSGKAQSDSRGQSGKGQSNGEAQSGAKGQSGAKQCLVLRGMVNTVKQVGTKC